MTLSLTVVGAALILIMLRDIFHTLFNPSSSGALSNRLVRLLWQSSRKVSRHLPGLLSITGPAAMLLVIAIWGIGLVLGWALVLWPRMPEQFVLSTGLAPEENGSFWDAVYLSTVTLATLGYGDLTPTTTWLRLIAPLEALIGFGLFTASVSWILSVYPVLARRRNLAREVLLLRKTGQWSTLVSQKEGADALNSILLGLGQQVVSARNDYLQFPVTYYFHQPDRDAALEVALPHLAVFASQASDHPSPSVRFHAELLLVAIRDLAEYLADSILDLGDASKQDILRAHAEDHLRDPDPEITNAGDILNQDPE